MSDRFELGRQLAENIQESDEPLEGESAASFEMYQVLTRLKNEGKLNTDECLQAYKDWSEGYYG